MTTTPDNMPTTGGADLRPNLARTSARLPLNIERSAYRAGEYVGYDVVASPGIWRIKRREGGTGWRASHSLKPSAGFIFGRTLAEIGDKLADPVALARAFGSVSA